MEHKRGQEGNRIFAIRERLKEPAVIVVILVLAFGVYSMFYSDITGKLIARPQNECSVANGAVSGVMLLGTTGQFQIAGAVQKQNTCGIPAQRPAGELKQFLLLGTRCEAGADDIITLSLENSNTQRLKSACALPDYTETPHSDKLVKHVCAGNDVQVNLIGCDCQNNDCAISACVNNDQCFALPDGTMRGCQDKNNGLGKRCYKTAPGTACSFTDECGQGLKCISGTCRSEQELQLLGGAPPLPPVEVAPGAGDGAAPGARLLRSPVEDLVANSQTSVVGRVISPVDPEPGAEVTVTLIVNEVGEEGSYIIEETVPQGWQISEAAGFVQNVNLLTIGPVIEGLVPGVKVEDTRYTYKVRAPQEPTQATFSGTFRFESMDASAAIVGNTAVTVPSVAEVWQQAAPEVKEAIMEIAKNRGEMPEIRLLPSAGELGGACRTPGNIITPVIPCNAGLRCDSGVCVEAEEEAAGAFLLDRELNIGDAPHNSKFAVITFTPTFISDSPFLTFVLTTTGITSANGPGFVENYALVYNKDGGYEIFRLNDQIREGAGEQPVRIQVAKERLKSDDLNFLYIVAGNRNGDYADFSIKRIDVEGAILGPEITVTDYISAGERAAGMLGQLEGVIIAHKAGGRLKQVGEACREDRECSSGKCVGTEVGRRCASVGDKEAGNKQPTGGNGRQGNAPLPPPPSPGLTNLGEGSLCVASNECAQGLVCRRITTKKGKFYGDKKCLKPRADGGKCEANTDCESRKCDGGVCMEVAEDADAPAAPKKAVKEDCAYDDECVVGLKCAMRASDQPKKCLKPAGTACTDTNQNSECVPNTVCSRRMGAQDQLCLGLAGYACSVNGNAGDFLCAPDHVCFDRDDNAARCIRVVTEIVRAGALQTPKPCAAGECNDDQVCIGGLCYAVTPPAPAQGGDAGRIRAAQCNTHADCDETMYYCDASTKHCTAKKANDAACTVGHECISGICKDNKCSATKVICTELNRQGIMPDSHLKASQQFADKYLDETTMHGYHYWARPLARVMQRSPKVTKLVAPLGLAWGKYVAYEIGVSKETSAIGEILVKQGEAASREIGVFLEKNGVTGEVDEKTMEALAYKHLTGMFNGSEKETIARLNERMPGLFADIKAYASSQKLYKQKNQ